MRYVDAKAPDERGFLSRIFGGEQAGKAQRLRIALLGGTAATGGRTVLVVQDAEGGALVGDTGDRIAAVLLDQLK